MKILTVPGTQEDSAPRWASAHPRRHYLGHRAAWLIDEVFLVAVKELELSYHIMDVYSSKRWFSYYRNVI